jgi:Type IV secretory pathway, VirB4 components
MPDIRPSQSSWDLIDTLKRVWDMRVNYAPIRIAIGRSLLSGDTPDPADYAAGDRSIDTQQIFSGGGTDYTPLYHALIVQRHGRVLSDEEFLQMVKAHIDHGFKLIAEDTKDFKNTDDYVNYLVELVQAGLENRNLKPAPIPVETPAFKGLIDLQIGWTANNEIPVSVEFNRRTNSYLAVTGKPGSGKTQFVKDLLAQIRQKSDYQVNFIFFDYAKGDVADDASFIEATQATVIRLPEESLPVNPFARVNVRSEMAVKIAAQEFADLIRGVERQMGIVQGERLYKAILTGFETMRGANPPFPDFEIIKQEIDTEYFILNNFKPDTLTEIVRQLSEFRVFARNDDRDVWNSLTDRTVIIDLHELTVLREMTVSLVLNTLYRELMAMPDTEVRDGAREMRTIIVIDEAHHFLKDKRRNAILERLIREIRSKGASVFLLSQSPDDYDQPDFDFAELLEFIFLLQSNAGATKFLQNAFGVSSQEAKQLSSEVASLQTAHAIGKAYDEKEKVNRLRVRQFWRDKGN